MSLFLALVIIVVAPQLEAAKDALHRDAFPFFAGFARLGVINRIDLIGSRLEKLTDQFVGWLEDGGADESFQPLDGEGFFSILTLESGDYLLDFLVLGEEELRGRWVFFFFASSLAISLRVFSTT
jgi:hypothetical protein